MKEIEVEGKTVTMAVEKGLAELGLRRDQVEVQVLQEASPGFLGMGTKLARVRVREKIWGEEEHKDQSQPSMTPGRSVNTVKTASRPARPSGASRPSSAPTSSRQQRPRDYRPATTEGQTTSSPIAHQPPADPALACAEAKTLLDAMLGALQIASPKVTTNWDADQVRVRADVETADAQFLLGRDGRSLESLQFLTTLILSRKIKTPVAVQVDTVGYWKEKEEGVIRQVHQAMEMVKRTSQPVRLKPMDACLRRLVHRTLANHPEIETTSEGEGPWRKVVLKPKRK